MPRITKIYTRQGDDGNTSLGSRQRVAKNHLRVRAYGTVDELNSILGMALSHGVSETIQPALLAIQNELFHLGADLSFTEEDKEAYKIPQILPHHIDKLEQQIDQINEIVGPLENFILPGGTISSSILHVARTICRRAEREVVSLSQNEAVSPNVIPYLNRLSDLLFVMARFENKHSGVTEPLWDTST